MGLPNALLNIDRKFIFAGVALSIAIPLLNPIGFGTSVTRQVQNVYDFVEKLEEGSTVILSFDYEPSTMAELDPMARTLLKHLFRKKARVLGMALLAGAPGIAESILQEEADAAEKEYGIEWVFLGYVPAPTAAMLRIGEDISMVYPTDQYGTLITEFPLMRSVKNYRDIDLVISLSSTAMPQFWAQYAHDRYGAPVAVGATAVEAIRMYPYHDSGQIVGFLGGLKGAAEYETLVGQPGEGIKGMDAQTIAHLFMVLMIVIGNVGHVIERRRGKSS